ncbi:MAG: 30S ribosomal protein S20 [Deltaproteobacteria bacterium]|nr:30S ribosomal protein S20 [Deltaproteobacteria bacterium]
MANHPSAERRNRQRIRKTLRNKSVKRAVRTQLTKARELVDTKKNTEAKVAAKVVEATVDKAASKGIIHRKAAARLKARLYRRIAAASKAG